MIIVEGADLVGKTNLCRRLVTHLNELGWPHVYQHLSRLPPCWRQEAVSNYARIASPYVVQDRFHMSEPIYSAAREEKPMINPSLYRQVDATLYGYGVYVIVVVADPRLIRVRYAAKGERPEMYPLDRILEVNDQYTAMIKSGGHWGDYQMSFDLAIECDESHPFPEMPQLKAYTLRMCKSFPYLGASAA
jgi:thymidylate kinase